MKLNKDIIQSCIFVVLFTHIGVSTRLGLTVLSESVGDSFLPSLGASFFLPNIFGSFVMGLTVSLVECFRDRTHWQTGISSGFCGSCTTFSSWQKTAAYSMLNGQIADSVLILLITFCTSYLALVAGRHLGEQMTIVTRKSRKGKTYTEQQKPEIASDQEKPASPAAGTEKPLLGDVSLALFTIINGALWIAAFFDPSSARRRWWIVIALGPVGSLIRYLTSLYNKKFPKFPLATFLVNVFASVIAMVLLVVQHFLQSKSASDQPRYLELFDLWATNGVGVGLLGSLSTVSTFVNELHKLSAPNKLLQGYVYGLGTVMVAQVLCLLTGCALLLR